MKFHPNAARWLAIGCCVLMAFLVVPGNRATAADSIKIGFILELTGPGSFYGVAAKESIELRLEEANYEVAGKSIEPIWEDSATKPATAIQKAKKLIEFDEVDLLFGTLFSDAQDAMAPYLANQDILNIAAIGGSWELRKYGNWLVFPGTPYVSDSPLGDYAYEQGYRTMVTLGNDYSAGYGHVAGPVDRFKAKGGTIVDQVWVPYGTSDYAPYLTALKEADVFFQWTVMPDLLVLLKQYYGYGVKIPLLIGEAEAVGSGQLAEIGPQVVGAKGILRGYSRRLDNPENHKFVAAFRTKYGRYPGQMDGFAYACMSIYLAGLEATGGDARLEVLRPAILKLNVDTPVGPVSFSSNGYALSNRYLAEVKVIDGEYVWEPFRTIEKVRDPRDE